MRRIWRLGLVAAAAAVAFGLATVHFSDAAEAGCAQRVPEDLSYEVRWSERPAMDVLGYRLSITRGGRPVMGANVCVNTYMAGMSAMAAADRAVEVVPGSYDLELLFEMGGKWPGRVLIAEPGKRTVAVPLSLDVKHAGGMMMMMP
jgi:hypothetical protein